MRVTAINKGYFGGEIRDPGAVFELPDAEWDDEDRRPSWVEAVDPKDDGADDDEGEDGPPPANSAKAPKAPDKVPAKRGRKPKALDETKGNGVKEALGTDPDWLPPGANGNSATE